MPSLADVLATLTDERGQLDLGARRRQLDSLVAQLLPAEVLHVKRLLAERTRRIDFVPNLPPELFLAISDYLSLPEFSALQTVSSTWLQCCTRPDVVDHAARRHYRVLYDTCAYQSATASARLTLLNLMSRRESDLRDDRYHSSSYYCYAQNKAISRHRSYHCYGQDRVAWRAAETIFLKDLMSGETKRFVTPERLRITQFCIKGDYLIGATSSSATLYAWSIASGECDQIRLPSVPLIFDIKRGRVFISLRNGTLLEWTVRQGLKQLNIPSDEAIALWIPVNAVFPFPDY